MPSRGRWICCFTCPGKANVNVLDIPMALLTAQYLTYIERAMRSHNLELAADYLVMAAMLIEIKSRMLLPRPRQAEGEEVGKTRVQNWSAVWWNMSR